MHVSEGHPGSRPDKTIVKTDKFLQAIKNKEILYDDVTFQLYNADGSTTTHRGAYIIADNGYAKWRMFQAPIKSSSSMEELKWSTRLESVRKDVECFFGRLKIRFRILRSRILFQKQGYIDNVFYASCIMHNMLLKDDGLDEGWDEGEDGDDDDLREGLEMRRIRLRLNGIRSVPSVSGGLRNVNVPNVDDDDEDVVECDSHYEFRTQLITHYTYAKAHGKVTWLRHQN